MNTFLTVCLMAATVATLAGCHSTESVSPATVQSVSAHLVESRQQDAPILIQVTGTLHARESSTLSAQVMGRVEQVLVREGDEVHAGQILVVLDGATLNSAVDQAQAAVKAAQQQQLAAQSEAALAASTLERYKQLQAQKSVSPQEMDVVTRHAESATAQVNVLRAQSEAAHAQESGARAMLGYTKLRAPFAGVVTARLVDPGALAAPGVPLLQVDSNGPLQLQASVDESAIASLRKGMKIAVEIKGAASVQNSGTVAEILPAADAASHSFLVKIDLAASRDLKAGMYGSAAFATGKHQVILIPRSAVVTRGSLQCIYEIDGNRIAQMRAITLGAAQGDLVEVLSGVGSGEKLIDQPGDRDLAGMRIEVQ